MSVEAIETTKPEKIGIIEGPDKRIILLAEHYTPATEPPYFHIAWPTNVTYQTGLEASVANYLDIDLYHETPDGHDIAEPLELDFQCKDSPQNTMCFSVDPFTLTTTPRFVQDITSVDDFNPESPWFVFSTPFATYYFETEMQPGKAEKTFVIQSSHNLTTHIVSLYHATRAHDLSPNDIIRAGVNLRNILQKYPRL